MKTRMFYMQVRTSLICDSLSAVLRQLVAYLKYLKVLFHLTCGKVNLGLDTRLGVNFSGSTTAEI